MLHHLIHVLSQWPDLWVIMGAVVSTRSINITRTGDATGSETLSAANNATSVGDITSQDLVNGANTITVPAATGQTCTAVTIVPPAANGTAITLKGVSGDTGIAISKTDPTSIGLGAGVTSFV